MHNNLKSFIELLESKGELRRVTQEVSTQLEIAQITDVECKSPGGGKALLFENNGTPFPVVTNIMGSESRIKLAMRCDDLGELGRRIFEMFNAATSPKKSFFDKLKMLPLLSNVNRWMPRYKKGFGECQQMVMMGDDVDLSLLPILKCAPYDGGEFITLPLVTTASPENGARNVGMYRMQLIDERTTAMHWHTHKTGERHYRAHKEVGTIMPVTVAIGGDVAYTYSATAPLPEGIDEYILAGFIRQKNVDLVKCLTNDLYVPNDCDFVIEGYVDPSEDKFWEGPFGDHTGFYSLEDYYPKFHVTCITHRRDAIYPATLVGVPPMEDAYIAKATESIFLAPIRMVLQPEITDMWLPDEGVAHNIAIINIEKSYIGQPQKVALAMWGAGQMMFNKFSIITSLPTELSIRDLDLLKEQVKYVDIERDTIITQGTLDVLDHAAPQCGFGGKLSIDATIKEDCTLEPFSASKELPEEVETSLAEQGWAAITSYVARDVDFKQYATNLIDNYKISGVKFLLIFDPKVRALSTNQKVWFMVSSCDAKRDSFIYKGILVLDGRIKAGGINGFNRRWPNIVEPQGEELQNLNSCSSAEYQV
ncbi:MAG: menaquinone biosynthesis decarboxylase [Rikenellaceae bacterium]